MKVVVYVPCSSLDNGFEDDQFKKNLKHIKKQMKKFLDISKDSVLYLPAFGRVDVLTLPEISDPSTSCACGGNCNIT